MSLAAKMKLRKLAALQAAQETADQQRAEFAQSLQRRSEERLAQPFDQEAMVPAPAVSAALSSPAAQMKQQKLARLAIEQDGAEGQAPDRRTDGEGATEYELLLAALGEDEAALKAISSTERKEEAKRQLISKFDAHVDATLAAALDTGKAVQDEIAAMMMIWRFDIGDWDRGLDIAEHMLRHGLRLPSIKNFLRTPATIICEFAAEAALRALGTDKDFDIAVLHRASQLTGGYDMPDQVRAKMEKAIALQLIRHAEAADSNPDSVAAGGAYAARAQALDHLRRALELDKNCGVKKQIATMESWLKKRSVAVEGEGGDADTPAVTTE